MFIISCINIFEILFFFIYSSLAIVNAASLSNSPAKTAPKTALAPAMIIHAAASGHMASLL